MIRSARPIGGSAPWYRRAPNGRAVAIALLAWALAFPRTRGQASLAWDASLVRPHRFYLHYGVASRVYASGSTSEINAHTVSNLIADRPTFFVRPAYDAARELEWLLERAIVPVSGPAPAQTSLAPPRIGHRRAALTFTATVSGSAPTGNVTLHRQRHHDQWMQRSRARCPAIQVRAHCV